MYIPAHNRQDDPAVIREFIHAARLGSLVTVEDGIPLVCHVPMSLLEDSTEHGTVVCHLSRRNPQAGKTSRSPTSKA
jgi:predicted FMN-binding regulatory protein PaiB